MEPHPSTPDATDAPPELFEGHLWIHERVDGLPVRFGLRADGTLRFGGRTRTFGTDVPLPYRHVARHLRERLDRAALREAVEDVESVTFFGRATVRRRIDYDWETIPSFLGHDVAEDGNVLVPDASERVYDSLGLAPVNTFDREVRAASFDPETYEVPDSEWYDGPAAGVVVRNKTGHRGMIGARLPAPDRNRVDAETLVARQATDERFERVARRLEADGRPVTFEALYERTLADIVREHCRRFLDDEVDVETVRAELSERTGRYLAGRS